MSNNKRVVDESIPSLHWSNLNDEFRLVGNSFTYDGTNISEVAAREHTLENYKNSDTLAFGSLEEEDCVNHLLTKAHLRYCSSSRRT